MEQEFELEINYKGQLQKFPAKMNSTGYSYRLTVSFGDEQCIFERDDEHKWRALLPFGTDSQAGNIDKNLIEAIGQLLEKSFP